MNLATKEWSMVLIGLIRDYAQYCKEDSVAQADTTYRTILQHLRQHPNELQLR